MRTAHRRLPAAAARQVRVRPWVADCSATRRNCAVSSTRPARAGTGLGASSHTAELTCAPWSATPSTRPISAGRSTAPDSARTERAATSSTTTTTEAAQRQPSVWNRFEHRRRTSPAASSSTLNEICWNSFCRRSTPPLPWIIIIIIISSSSSILSIVIRILAGRRR